MDDPRYIILVALDTPSTSTGIYISGGVMAAPTVGAVLADILPYLEVKRETEPVLVQVPQLLGMTGKEAAEALSQAGLAAVSRGDADAVTAQLPEPGTWLEQGTQVLLFLESAVPGRVVVPDFAGMTVREAEAAAADAGLILQWAGNPQGIRVQLQDVPAGTEAEPGTTITITLTDPAAQD